ncbi:hypothetical protein D3C81_1584960 [compost metagenome]
MEVLVKGPFFKTLVLIVNMKDFMVIHKTFDVGGGPVNPIVVKLIGNSCNLSFTCFLRIYTMIVSFGMRRNMNDILIVANMFENIYFT